MFPLFCLTFLVSLCVVTSDSPPSIIIVGGGAAGIAAAAKLLENSFTDIKIIEAEDRIGGRIHSVRFGQKFVDIGAEYCHGQKNNVVFELVKDANLLRPISADFHTTLYYSNGSKLEQTFVEELQAVILGYDESSKDYNSTGSSMGELFQKKYSATIVAKYGQDCEKTKLLREALRLAEQVSLMIDGAFSWLDTSTVKHYERSEGHQLLVWGGRGYKTILDVLLKRFPHPSQTLPIQDKIFLNTKVLQINWANSVNRVSVSKNTSSYYEADHIIFTPSVGVLKEQHQTLFVPPLPPSKVRAIDDVGIAGVMKIIMRFDRAWWRDDDILFAFLWDEEDLRNVLTEFQAGPAKDGISWLSAVTLMATVPGNSDVLVAWVTGPFVPEIEKTETDVLKDGCTYLMKKFFGKNYNINAPEEILKSTWRSNPHFRGTYSYERAGFENGNVSYQSDLAEPLRNGQGKPVVLFAGEATNPIHYSTVHGAIESGFREAERIINLYKNIDKP